MNKKQLIALTMLLALTTARAADIAISGLPAASSVTGADVVPIVQSATTKKASFTVQKSFWDTMYQSLDGDLTALSALTGTNTIYYRSAASTWTAVTIGNGLHFTAGTLAVNTPTPTPTFTPTPTATATATATPTPTATPTATVAVSFGTVAVSGQSDVVADGASDTLNVAAGSNITLTTNAITDTVTIAASGVGDVSSDTSTSVDSEVALFESTTGKLIKRATGSGIAELTNGVLSISGLSTVATFGQIELTNTDTSITRSSAGHIAVEGHVLLDVETAQTATLKRIVPRTHSVSSSTSWTPDFDTYDEEIQTALAGAVTINNPTYANPNEGERRILRITGTAARAISWDTAFRAGTSVALPTTTTTTKTLYCGFMYNSTAGTWDLMAYTDGY